MTERKVRQSTLSPARISKRYTSCRKWKTEDSYNFSATSPVCDECTYKSQRRKEPRSTRPGHGTRANAARQTSTRVSPQRPQSASAQSRIVPIAQAVKTKLRKCNESGVFFAEERRLFSGTRVLCITCAAVRYKLEIESLELCSASSTTGSSYRTIVGRDMNNDQPVDGHMPRSLNDAILYATVHTRDQVPRLCTTSGSIQDLRRPKKKVRCNQWLE